jgi:hypothetical protein
MYYVRVVTAKAEKLNLFVVKCNSITWYLNNIKEILSFLEGKNLKRKFYFI